MGLRRAVPAELDIPQKNGQGSRFGFSIFIAPVTTAGTSQVSGPSHSWISRHLPRGRGTSKDNKPQCPLWELRSSLVQRHLALSNTTSGSTAPCSNRVVFELMYGLLQYLSPIGHHFKVAISVHCHQVGTCHDMTLDVTRT